ncbi:MAG TPA: alpha/beta hydrolase [Acidimicrobiales bacterium]|nr:alpha/beta hydrolase [Acidimicrobiales bacterium]
MARATVNDGIELEYDTFGSAGDPAFILISGLGAQMISFHPDFCEGLAARGYFVVRFDNRDVGLSTKCPPEPEAPERDRSGYALEDMADDVAGLLDALDIPSAHVVGVSMGGMIAQTMAIRHPARVRTLTSIMSTTGAPGVGGATEEAMARLTVRAGDTRDERVASSVETSRIIWGDTPQFPFDEELARWRAETSVDRAYYPEGTVRQMLAIRATGDRTDRLRTLDVPALVIHGSNDPLVQPSGGEATAAAIPGAEHLVIEGMGHGLARPAFGPIIESLDRLAAVPSKE